MTLTMRSHMPRWAMRKTVTVPCRIRVEHTFDSLEAHVELADGVQPEVGDRVRVHGSTIQVPFGESVIIDRMATVLRATPIEKMWTKLMAHFELTELYEVSFTNGRL